MEHYARLKKLGEGGFGLIFLVKDRRDNQLYVMKEVDLGKLDAKARTDAINEAEFLRQLRHPNIIGYREYSVEETTVNTRFGPVASSKLFIVMHYADGGDLEARVRAQREPFSEGEILDWLVQLALALKHLHDKHVLHRDIKTQNVFLSGRHGLVKLGDFGIARSLASTQAQAVTMIGTPYYLSPEICQEQPYGTKSDVWAMGIVLYELMCLRHPFTGANMRELLTRICDTHPDPPPRGVYSKELRGLLARLLDKDPARRPTVAAVLAMPLIRSRISRFLSANSAQEELSETVVAAAGSLRAAAAAAGPRPGHGGPGLGQGQGQGHRRALGGAPPLRASATDGEDAFVPVPVPEHSDDDDEAANLLYHHMHNDAGSRGKREDPGAAADAVIAKQRALALKAKAKHQRERGAALAAAAERDQAAAARARANKPRVPPSSSSCSSSSSSSSANVRAAREARARAEAASIARSAASAASRAGAAGGGASWAGPGTAATAAKQQQQQRRVPQRQQPMVSDKWADVSVEIYAPPARAGAKGGKGVQPIIPGNSSSSSSGVGRKQPPQGETEYEAALRKAREEYALEREQARRRQLGLPSLEEEEQASAAVPPEGAHEEGQEEEEEGKGVGPALPPVPAATSTSTPTTSSSSSSSSSSGEAQSYESALAQARAEYLRDRMAVEQKMRGLVQGRDEENEDVDVRVESNANAAVSQGHHQMPPLPPPPPSSKAPLEPSEPSPLPSPSLSYEDQLAEARAAAAAERRWLQQQAARYLAEAEADARAADAAAQPAAGAAGDVVFARPRPSKAAQAAASVAAPPKAKAPVTTTTRAPAVQGQKARPTVPQPKQPLPEQANPSEEQEEGAAVALHALGSMAKDASEFLMLCNDMRAALDDASTDQGSPSSSSLAASSPSEEDDDEARVFVPVRACKTALPASAVVGARVGWAAGGQSRALVVLAGDDGRVIGTVGVDGFVVDAQGSIVGYCPP